MPDVTDHSRVTASPYSTGGGGTRFEHRLGTVFLVRLLTGEPVAELGDGAPERVAFQQSPATSVDDLVVTASAPGGVSVRLEIAVRRKPRFVRSDKKTIALVEALVQADLDAERGADPLIERRLAVAVSGRQAHAREIAELATVARGQSRADEFMELIRTPGRFATRPRLNHLVDMVAAALIEIADEDAGTPEYRCWSLLRRLWIMQVDLEAGHEGDWTRLAADLKPVALDPSDDVAVALRNRLEQVSAELASSAGVVDAAALGRYLHGAVNPDAHVPPVGWARLLELDEQSRNAVTRWITGAGSTTVTLPRRAIRDDLEMAMGNDGDLVVKGDSGVGKSALAMDAIEPDRLGDNRQAIAINLRHLPRTQLELLALLSAPIAELFSELTAPDRLLVIDSAEAAAEDHGDVFSYLLRGARTAGLRVIAVATTDGAGVVSQLLRSGASEPREFEVQGLDDEELASAAAQIPVLQGLVDNPRARELLRRPIVIDLLGRADDPGLPLSESEALDHIWHQLVRNSDRPGGGAPDAREQVMLRLADYAVRKGEVDGLLARLDDPAVEGLRRSGLLLPASRLPWERVPAFKHDLLRVYSVARLLLEERDPAAALMAIGAPRWTLPSARLACEILLSAPDEPSHLRASRFAWLQTGFDAIASTGGGERWSDVPTEALLSAPDAAELLKDAWPTLLLGEAQGLERLIRLLHARHQRAGILDSTIAEPVISQLLDVGYPRHVTDEVAELVSDWLRAHVLRGTPAGQPTRAALRDIILDQCAENERRLDEEEAARQAELAARTPEEIAADEERRKKVAAITSISMPRRRRRPEPTRHRPYEWIRDAQVEQLALLGPDLGPGGEAVLRRIAEDEPQSLEHAVESLFAGQSLGTYDPGLLIDLAAAYYIDEDGDEDDDGFGWSGGLYDEGIRHHRFGGLGSPLASFTHGPFLSLFRVDYRGGVALLNRMLDHAARCRVLILSSLRHGGPASEDSHGMRHSLSVADGESREYIGDGNVWLWYRGTGVGPYPCMSALQALEFVTEQHIRAGVPPHVLTSIMLEGTHNLAMPALALAVLVRHLEIAGEAIGSFLVEPTVWELEFSRVVSEHAGLAARMPELPNPERRGWSLREVSTMLTLRAEGDRIPQLKALGEQLLASARAEIGEDSSADASEHLAAVRNWAAALDRGAYEVRREEDHLLVQQTANPEVEQVLGKTNADLRRTNDAVGLIVRHANARDNGAPAPDIGNEALAADVSLARDLLDNPPQSAGFALDGPVAVAASAVELHLTGRSTISDDNLVWSATVLLQVAAEFGEQSSYLSDISLFNQGADRSAARGLPFLLLPAARELRTALGVDQSDDVDELIELSRAIAVRGVSETRLAYARALDIVWMAPCDTAHLYGRCHHLVAIELVRESFLESVFGPWDSEAQRRTIVGLDPPEASSLDALEGDNIYVPRLTPALRSTGAAAISQACTRDEARAILGCLLAAHQRAMLAYEHEYHQSQSDSLVAARAG